VELLSAAGVAGLLLNSRGADGSGDANMTRLHPMLNGGCSHLAIGVSVPHFGAWLLLFASLPLRAWKAAQNGAFHIATATAAACLINAKNKNQPKPRDLYRFLYRTEKTCGTIVNPRSPGLKEIYEVLNLGIAMLLRKISGA